MPSWRHNSTEWRTPSLTRSRRFSKPLQYSKSVSCPSPEKLRRQGHQGDQVNENTSRVRWGESRREKIREEERRYEKIGARSNMKLRKRPARLFSSPDSTHSDNPRGYGVSLVPVKKKVIERDISHLLREAGKVTAHTGMGSWWKKPADTKRIRVRTAQTSHAEAQPLPGWPARQR